MSGRLLDVDPLTGATETIYDDGVDPSWKVVTAVDIQPVLEENQHQHNQFRGPRGGGFKGDGMHWVAQIPLSILQSEVYAKGLHKDPKAFKKWLNDPDNRVFRTRPGKV